MNDIKNIQEHIDYQVKNNHVVLFMKGTATFPQCGFSGRVVHVLKECGADFVDVNVLESDALRQGIKAYGNWPTIPQLYIDGTLVGGCDIVMDLYRSGELKKLVA